MTSNFRDSCAEMLKILSKYHHILEETYHPDSAEAKELDVGFHVLERARAVLAASEQGPTDDQIYDCWIETLLELGCGDPVVFARTLLTRWGRPAVEAVLVAERLPGPEDCDDRERCWFGTPGSDVMDAYWVYRKAEHRRQWDTHWAPHWAFPVPQEANQ